MALHIIRKEDLPDIYKNNESVIHLNNSADIQQKFCSCLEYNDDNGVSFFGEPCIKEYLDSIGIVYGGDYRVGSRIWYDTEAPTDELEWHFVTFLSYWVQAAILMLYYDKCVIVCETTAALDRKFSPYALKQREVYFVCDGIEYYWLQDYVKAGVDVYLHGGYLNGISDKELFDLLVNKECEISFLTRELDAEVFPEAFGEDEFTAYSTSMLDFAKKSGANYFEGMLPDDITMLVNSNTFVSRVFRRYPLHQLFEYEGQWYYRVENSVKYPECEEMLGEISFWLDDAGIEKSHIVRNAARVLTLVLDCDEVCDVRKYWESVGFVSIYDRENRTLEICEKTKGIKMFHELFQKSVDLEVEA